MAAEYFGADIKFTLLESYKVERQAREDSDIITRKYTTRAPVEKHDTLIPAWNTAEKDFPFHKLKEKLIVPRYPDLFDVTLIYARDLSSSGTLPSPKEGYVGGTIERFLGAHPKGSPTQGGSFDVVWNWLGKPTADGTSTGKKDLRGVPSDINASGGNPTYKPGVESYLIPTLYYWRETYHTSKPDETTSNIGKLEIPPNHSGANKWLKMSWTAERDKIGGFWKLRQEWQKLPTGTWDPDVYDVV